MCDGGSSCQALDGWVGSLPDRQGIFLSVIALAWSRICSQAVASTWWTLNPCWQGVSVVQRSLMDCGSVLIDGSVGVVLQSAELMSF